MKEARLRQRGCVIWLYGLSGAGKTTLASLLETRLAHDGYLTSLLDGDILRTGLNRGLGFTDADRAENLRRAAETARLFTHSGIVTLCAFITPLAANRQMVRTIIGPDDLMEVYVSASFATCARRDPKGLYARAAAGSVPQFTGRDSGFEPPAEGESPLIIDSENENVVTSTERLHAHVLPRVRLSS
jgi:adenylylsulfate kinase